MLMKNVRFLGKMFSSLQFRNPQIKELLTLLRDKIAVQSRHLQWKDFQKNEPYAHRFCAGDSFLLSHSRAIVKNITFRSMGIFIWEFPVKYNIKNVTFGSMGILYGNFKCYNNNVYHIASRLRM